LQKPFLSGQPFLSLQPAPDSVLPDGVLKV
jgi:hypothetical protein